MLITTVRQLTFWLTLFSAITGCGLAPDPFTASLGDTNLYPELAGTWAIGTDGQFFALLTVDDTGQLSKICRQVDLAAIGIDTVTLDGQPHSAGQGLTATAAASLLKVNDQIRIDLNVSVEAGAVTINNTSITLAGSLDLEDRWTGTMIMTCHNFGESDLRHGDVFVKRIAPAGQACLADDQFEPNDSISQPAVLQLGEDKHLKNFNDDWYTVDTEATMVRVRMTFEPALGSLQMAVFDRNGDPVSTDSDSGKQWADLAGQVGAYHIRIRATSDGGNPDYQLILSPVTEDLFEPNDKPSESQTVVINKTYSLSLLSDDWYQIFLPTTVRLKVE